jgi:hypothetical protein
MKKRCFSALLLMAVAMATTASCSKDSTDSPSSETSTQPFDDNGASRALFSVAADRQVRLSRGNLQYQASTGTWRFAEKQYDVVGVTNSFVSANNEDWIDLFGWGTSGWESGANAYHPWSISVNGADYQPGGSWQNGLFGDYADADWGVYNSISNGGNQAGMWRTLKNTEWAYLFGGGKRAGRWGRASIDGRYNGIILLPDEWTAPDGITFQPALVGYDSNVYTIEQWERMEAAGAVFLPAAGYRERTAFGTLNEHGAYWSVSPLNANYPDCALSLIFNENELYPSAGVSRGYGFSVRLVQDL